MSRLIFYAPLVHWNRNVRTRRVAITEACKIIPVCLNFRGLAPASLSKQPQHAKSAIFAKIGRKTRNLAGTILHNSVQSQNATPERRSIVILHPHFGLHSQFLFAFLDFKLSKRSPKEVQT